MIGLAKKETLRQPEAVFNLVLEGYPAHKPAKNKQATSWKNQYPVD